MKVEEWSKTLVKFLATDHCRYLLMLNEVVNILRQYSYHVQYEKPFLTSKILRNFNAMSCILYSIN